MSSHKLPVSMKHLPRLAREFYQGHAYVHWSMTVEKRKTGWLSPQVHAQLREVLLHALHREKLACPAYCLMPDHVHFLLMGLAPDSDQWIAVNFIREHSARLIEPHTWQRQAYDNVLREADRERNAFQRTAWYVFENPVRAGLVSSQAEYGFSGSLIAGFPKLDPFEDGYWDLFWRIVDKLRVPLPLQ